MRQLLLLATLFISISASARAEWTKVETNTTANLWGVCYGGGQYVAVGTSGTILTSPDGTKWIARTSGTTEWLTAVAYGNNLYVAVGDHGRILTSTDAVTWVTRESSGERLNGIAFGAGRFLAVGENGTVRASTDALTWSTRMLPVNTWLRGVCCGPGGFFIGAGNGAMAATTDGLVFRFAGTNFGSREALFYSERAIWSAGTYSNSAVVARTMLGGNARPTSESATYSETVGSPLRGIAQSGNAIIAVGSHGRVISSDLRQVNFASDPQQPGSDDLNAIVSGPTETVIVGNIGSIYVSPLRNAYPNTPNSVAIEAAPAALFADGSMQLFAVAEGARPFTYQWSHDGQPIAGSTRDYLVLTGATAANTGRYSVLIRNSLGTANAEFVLSSLQENPVATVDSVFQSGSAMRLPDHVVPIHGGSFLMGSDLRVGVSELNRLRADGSWDLAFRSELARDWIAAAADGGLLGWNGDRQAVVKITLSGSLDPAFSPLPEGAPIPLADGRIVTVTIRNASVPGTPVIAELRRYDRDGNPDLSYGLHTVDWVAQGIEINTEFSVRAIARDADSRILVVLASNRQIGTLALGQNESEIFRLTVAGELDTSFPPVTITDETIVGAAIVGGKIYFRSVTPWAYSYYKTQITRYDAVGTPDSSYPPLVLYAGSDRVPATASALLHDGSALALDAGGLQMYAPNGQPSRHLDLTADGAISEILPLDDGRILIIGTFTSVNGVPTSGVARLALVTPTHDPATYLANLSIRTTAGSGDQTLITGFVVAGEGGTRSVLARGVGPGLVPLGINAGDVVTDPQLKLFHGQSVIATNDNWDSWLESTANALGAYPLARDSKDAALFTVLPPGAYTAHVTSTTGASGVALVELYDAGGIPTSASSPRLVNLSGRARVETGDNVLIAGFVLSGTNAKRLLIRAVGPGLRAQGVTDALADPQLTIYRGAEAIAMNDDWNSADQPVFKQVGAFDLTSGSKDAALIADLVPGVYTAVVRGANSSTGTALIEIYEVP